MSEMHLYVNGGKRTLPHDITWDTEIMDRLGWTSVHNMAVADNSNVSIMEDSILWLEQHLNTVYPQSDIYMIINWVSPYVYAYPYKNAWSSLDPRDNVTPTNYDMKQRRFWKLYTDAFDNSDIVWTQFISNVLLMQSILDKYRVKYIMSLEDGNLYSTLRNLEWKQEYASIVELTELINSSRFVGLHQDACTYADWFNRSEHDKIDRSWADVLCEVVRDLNPELSDFLKI